MVSSDLSRGGSGQQPGNPPGGAEAAALIQSLSKTARASRLYARNNESYLRFWADLVGKMQSYLSSRGQLSLQIGANELSVSGEAVYKLNRGDDSFAFRLYKDGLRRLEFQPGLTPGELQQFLDIIATDFDRMENVDSDVVSLLWEADFKHIQTISVDSFASEVMDETADENDEEQESIFASNEVDQIVEMLQQSADTHLMKLDNEERREYRQLTGGSAAFEFRSALDQGRIFDIDVLERAQLRAEADVPALEETPLALVAEILFELYRQEVPEAYGELIEVTLGVLGALLQEGDLPTVVQLLQPLRVLGHESLSRAFRNHHLVLDLFHRLGNAPYLQHISAAILEARLQGGRAALFGYFSLQVPENAETILTWLEHVGDLELRRAVLDAMVCVLGGEVEPFVHAVRGAGARLVADIIHCMGRVGNVQSLEVVLGSYGHSDPKVREEALVALRGFDSPRAREITVGALRDSEESVRLAALRYLAAQRERTAVRALLELVGAKSFKARSFQEKRAFFMTYAHILGREAVPFLSDQLKLKRMVEVQRAAAHGLSVVGGAEVRRMLETAAREGAPELANECRNLLTTLKG